MKARLEPRKNLAGRTPLETVIPLSTPFVVFADMVAYAKKSGHVDYIDTTTAVAAE